MKVSKVFLLICYPDSEYSVYYIKGQILAVAATSFAQGSVVPIPTRAIPPRSDDENSYSSIYSEDSDLLLPEPDVSTGPPRAHSKEIAQLFLKHGLNFDGMPVRGGNIYDNQVEAGAYTPFLTPKGEYFQREHIVLWDYFGGTSCLDLNVSALDTVMVVAEEYQVRCLGPIGSTVGDRFLRLPQKWSLGRWICADSTRQLEPVFGLIPEPFMVSTKFYNDNPELFVNPNWFIGLAMPKTAYQYLTSDISLMQPGLFCIFSPQYINVNPNDYRPYILMVVEESDQGKINTMYELVSKEVKRKTDVMEALLDEFLTTIQKNLSSEVPQTENRARGGNDPLEGESKTPQNSPAQANQSNANSKNVEECKVVEPTPQPFTIKVYTITRSPVGHYVLFDQLYATLFDLVHYLSNHSSPLTAPLVYGITSKKMETRLLCAVPPPCRQPKRDPLALMMRCEQWAAKHYDQVTEPTEQKSILTFLKRVPFNSGMHEKFWDYLDPRMPNTQEHDKCMSSLPKIKKDVNVSLETNFITNLEGSVEPSQIIYNEEDKIGSGAFGSVYRGEMILNAKEHVEGKKIKAAIKVQDISYSEEDSHASWANEIELLTNAYHPNITRLLGYCMDGKGKVLMAFELMMKGLDSFIQELYQHKSKSMHLTLNEQVDFMQQIARGMAYLHSLTPAIVHGDLAARNVLMKPHPTDHSRYRLKVTDFGISKLTLHEMATPYADIDKIPFKWCPREVQLRREMSPKADVWMFGVTLCELYGVISPYGIIDPPKLTPLLKEGKRIEKPDKMPFFIYELALKCWRKQPVDRLTFCEIVELIDGYNIESELEHVEMLLERDDARREK